MVRHGTYSIVARDPDTLELGVAVQSHWFSVGSVVPFAQAGVGAVAVQSVPDPQTGPAVLAALAAGETARDGLRRAVAGTDAGMRQVGIVDALGRTAGWTGAGCIAHAGDAHGPGFTAQANMMLEPGVPEAMAGAYDGAGDKPLAERLIAALAAAEAAGGDVRGRQSAALLVVPGVPDAPAHARSVDLRVDDHADPVRELRRLLVLHRAYALAGEADELVAQGRGAEAGPLYRQAARLAPGSDELLFWAGLAAGVSDGLPLVREAIERNPRWRELLDRLTPDVAPTADAIREAL
jgi:uncharacterized Ntn-hydrolase superfamily protein